MRFLIATSFLLLISLHSHADDVIVFSSGEQQTNLIELYTSEGCSSCPPADRWLSELKKDPGLWTETIPMAFHVDYWDYIGWNDRFAQQQFSQRQRLHKTQKNIYSVYTPGFIVNGNEWKGFFNFFDKSHPKSTNKARVLSVRIENNRALLEFSDSKTPKVFNFAVLGLGLTSEIQRGENAGKTLTHDFVVLHHENVVATQSVSVTMPEITQSARQYALSIWVSEENSLKPLQAVGGLLPENVFSIPAHDHRTLTQLSSSEKSGL